MEQKQTNRILFAILAVGLIARAAGVDFGLPFLYHNDEPIIVNYALAYGSGDLNPHFFKIPPFLSYILFFLYGVYYLIGHLVGSFGGVEDFGYLFLNDPTSFYLIGRFAAGVIPGTISIYLIYRLGRSMFSRTTGLLAALFLSLNFLHVRNSHYIYPDIPLVLFILLYFIALKTLCDKNRLKDYAVCGLILGLASSMKYNGVLLVVPTIIVVLRNMFIYRDKPLAVAKKGLLYAFFCAIALVVTNPFMVLDYRFFWTNISKMPFYSIDMWYHLKVSLLGGCGVLMCIAAVVGTFLAVKRKNFFGIMLAVFMAVYYLVLARSSQPAERYVFPILPIVLLFSAYGVTVLVERIRIRSVRVWVGSLCVVLLMASSAIKVYYCDRLFMGDDTRTQSYNWIKENISADTVIALDATGPVFPLLKQNRELVRESLKRFKNPKFDTPEGALDYKVKLFMENPGYPEETYELHYLRSPSSDDRFLMIYPEAPLDVDELEDRDVEYVITNSILLGGDENAFLNELEKRAELVKEFSGYKTGIERVRAQEVSNITAAPFSFRELVDRKQMGPVIRVYKLR